MERWLRSKPWYRCSSCAAVASAVLALSRGGGEVEQMVDSRVTQHVVKVSSCAFLQGAVRGWGRRSAHIEMNKRIRLKHLTPQGIVCVLAGVFVALSLAVY